MHTWDFFFWCDAATQLALQVQQERTQVVCGGKEARKRLARVAQLSRNWHMEPIMFVGIVVCAFSQHSLRPPAPMNHVKLFKDQPRRYALSELVQAWYQTFPPDHFGHLEINNPTMLRYKTSTA